MRGAWTKSWSVCSKDAPHLEPASLKPDYDDTTDHRGRTGDDSQGGEGSCVFADKLVSRKIVLSLLTNRFPNVYIWHVLVVNKLARAVTKRTKACDKTLLISYIHHTYEYRHNIVMWENTAQHCRLGLFSRL